MRKIKVLACGEASFLSSGYSTYMRNLLIELSKYDDIEIAEFGTYGHINDSRHNNKWKFFGNLPASKEEEAKYESNIIYEYGAFRFEETLLKFKPDVVFDIRDHWHFVHENNSPFRKHFNWIIMPAVDAEPQNPDWIHTFLQADGVLTYCDWNNELLKKQGNGNIKCFGAAPSAAETCFQPLNKDEIKKSVGLDRYQNIIGTVMRNQARKLYPDLFEAFSIFLNKTGRDDVWLLCHTTYPDGNGWDFPYYINKYNIGHRLLFTYQCLNCGAIEIKPFNDVFSPCANCGEIKSSMTNTSLGIGSQDLAYIYNCMDVYIQYANSEGFGMPQVEAACCGVPIMSVDYSAMSDIVRKVDGTPLRVKGFVNEIQTNCRRAIPDNEFLADKLSEFFNIPKTLRNLKSKNIEKLARNHFSWERTAEIWYNTIKTVSLNKKEDWNSPPKIYPINNTPPDNCSKEKFVEWLILDVLKDESELNSYFHSKLLRDLEIGFVKIGHGGFYSNEFLPVFFEQNYQPFGINEAFQMVANMATQRNFWEEQRVKSN